MANSLKPQETLVLDYLQKNSKALKSHIGVAVGKKPPKQAASWSTPILKKLLELNLITENKIGSRTFYEIKEKVPSIPPQSLPQNEVLEMLQDEHETPHSVNDGDYFSGKPAIEDKDYDTEKPSQPVKKVDIQENEDEGAFNISKCKREISKIVEQKIANKSEWETNRMCISSALNEWCTINGDIPTEFFQKVVRPIQNKYNPQPKVNKVKKNMLTDVPKQSIKNDVKKYYNEEILPNEKIKKKSYKRLLAKKTKSLLSKYLTEQNFRSNLVKSFIATVAIEVTTGRTRQIKNDGRPFVKGQRVKFENKNGEIKTGTITRVFIDKVFYQRTIVVLPDNATKTEMKIDRKIIEVIE